MKTFDEWLMDTQIEEGMGRNLLTMGLMGLGALGATGCSGGKCEVPQGQVQSANWADYTSPQGIKIGLDNRGNTAVVSIPSNLVSQYGSHVDKKALISLATYLQQSGGMSRIDVMQHYKLKSVGQDGNNKIFYFQQSYP